MSETTVEFLERMSRRVVGRPDRKRLAELATTFATGNNDHIDFLCQIVLPSAGGGDRLNDIIAQLKRVDWANAIVNGELAPMALFLRDVARRLPDKDCKLRAQAIRVADRIDEAGSFVDAKRLLEDINPASEDTDLEVALRSELDPTDGSEKVSEFLRRLSVSSQAIVAIVDRERLKRIVGLFERNERKLERKKKHGYARPPESDIEFLTRLSNRPSWQKDRTRLRRIVCKLENAAAPAADANIKPSKGGQTIGSDWAMVALTLRSRLPTGVGLYTREEGGSRVLLPDAWLKNLTNDNALAVEHLVTEFAERMRTLIGGPIPIAPAKVCPGCDNVIDPDVCHCGDSASAHDVYPSSHAFVAMGCDCARGTVEPKISPLPELCDERNAMAAAMRLVHTGEVDAQILGYVRREIEYRWRGIKHDVHVDEIADFSSEFKKAFSAFGQSAKQAGHNVNKAVEQFLKKNIVRSAIVDAAPPTVVMTREKPTRRYTSLAEFEYERGGVIKIGSKVHAAVSAHFLDGAGEFYVEKLAFYDEEANYDDAKETDALKPCERKWENDYSGLAGTPERKPDGELNSRSANSDWQCEGQCRSWNSNRTTSGMTVRTHCPYCGTRRPTNPGQAMAAGGAYHEAVEKSVNPVVELDGWKCACGRNNSDYSAGTIRMHCWNCGAERPSAPEQEPIVACEKGSFAFGPPFGKTIVATGKPGKTVHAREAMLNGKPYTPKDPVQESARGDAIADDYWKCVYGGCGRINQIVDEEMKCSSCGVRRDWKFRLGEYANEVNDVVTVADIADHWKCSCDRMVANVTEWCPNCGHGKPDVKGKAWTCPGCGQNNPAFNGTLDNCRHCGTGRPIDSRVDPKLFE